MDKKESVNVFVSVGMDRIEKYIKKNNVNMAFLTIGVVTVGILTVYRDVTINKRLDKMEKERRLESEG